MNLQALAVVVSMCAVAISLISVASSIYFAKKKSAIDDEGALTKRIARSSALEDEMRKIAESISLNSFQGRGAWVKELASEVFNDRLMVLLNQRVFVTSDALRPEMDSIKAGLSALTVSVRSIEQAMSTNLESAAEKGAERAIIRIRSEGL